MAIYFGFFYFAYVLTQCLCCSHLSLFIFRGRLECELRGDFYLKFKELFSKCYKCLPVVVIQFGKITRREGMYLGYNVKFI